MEKYKELINSWNFILQKGVKDEFKEVFWSELQVILGVVRKEYPSKPNKSVGNTFTCSECDNKVERTPYCPSCGHKIDWGM